MRTCILLVLCILLYAPLTEAESTPAAAPGAGADQSRERMRTVIIRHQKSTARMNETLETIKKAKASYIQELTAATTKARSYQSKKARRQMVGVYLFDMSYASAFNRKKQVRESMEAVQLLLKSLGVNDAKVNQQYQRLVKEYETATLQTLVVSYQKIVNDSLQEIAASEEGAALVSEAAYGWLIEGLYVTTELIIQQQYSPQIMYSINEHAEAIKPVVELMETVRSNANLTKTVAASERLSVLTAISAKLKDAESISKRELDAVRPIISKARAGIVN